MADDGETWAAARAVEGGLMIAAVSWGVELSEALMTGSHIGSHQNALIVSCLARLDDEHGVMSGWLFLSANPLDVGERWGLGN
jgi:hypothetical protein